MQDTLLPSRPSRATIYSMARTKNGRRRLLTIALLLLATVVGGTYCIREIWWAQFQENWEKVKEGMSKTQVQDLLGSPEEIYSSGAVQSNSLLDGLLVNSLLDSILERWAYGQRRLVTTSSAFPYVELVFDGVWGPEDDDYVIYFSPAGKVVRKVYPYRSR